MNDQQLITTQETADLLGVVSSAVHGKRYPKHPGFDATFPTPERGKGRSLLYRKVDVERWKKKRDARREARKASVLGSRSLDKTPNYDLDYLARNLGCSVDYLRDKLTPEGARFNPELAEAICACCGRIDFYLLRKFLASRKWIERIDEARASYLLGISIQELRSDSTIEKDPLGRYPISEIEKHAPRFSGSYRPSHYALQDCFADNELLHQIALNFHDNKIGNSPVDFTGSFDGFFQKRICEWRGDEPNGIVADYASDVDELRDVLLDRRNRQRFLKASVEVSISSDKQRVSIKLFGAARFTAEFAVPPFFVDLSEDDEI